MTGSIPASFKDLFVNKLCMMLDIERELVTALPKMAEAANDPELKQGFLNHHKQTQDHVLRLEEVFKSIGIEPEVARSEIIRSMIDEAEWTIDHIQDVNILDAALIASAQGVEHYEMALYGTAAAFAETLNLPDAKQLFEATLGEEKQADGILNTAAAKINNLAYQRTQDVEGEESKGFIGMGKMQTGNI